MPQLLSGTGGGLGGTVGGLAGGGIVGMTDFPHNVRTLVEYYIQIQHSGLPPDVLAALQGLGVLLANVVTFIVGALMTYGLAWAGAHFGFRVQNGGNPPKKPLAPPTAPG